MIDPTCWTEWEPDCWTREGKYFALDIGRDYIDSTEWTAALCIVIAMPDGDEDVEVFLSETFTDLSEAMQWADQQDQVTYQ